ncbi:L-ascorbate metabolism protein UlaG (beta-lactamase superfamily) [Silvimonas terrae]|uniref:L-ascorbate metabolism protein UlaG (Beta-lactamase superfamily) n=1 Tax=Silvimonas terrae TaxID=300266 RepID=A0A840RK38_9NEIS|nr:MBL fold metallo-hydrolase [Silvimonas terrae]MBB5193497.1 L-ascorbate metabolism protein UlaG (beta-lactamase superfamily) [Silvimonas terrae]
MTWMRRTLALALTALTGNPHRNLHYDAAKSHHTPTGFRNRYPHGRPSGEDLRRWRAERKAQHLPPPPTADLSAVAPNLDFIHQRQQDPAVTWIGHNTLLLQVAGLNILTDPVFSERCSPVQFAGPKRHQRPGVALGELPHIDLVLISHNHYDHLDYASVSALYRQAGGPPVFAVALGMDIWMKRKFPRLPADKLITLDWWESAQSGAATLTFVPVQHWSARTPLDRNATLWGGWVLEVNGFRFFFSGDLGYSKDVTDIAERFDGFDFAAIGIGAYEPRWFMHNQHVNPAESVQIHRELRSRQSMGIHWGTFELTDEALDQPPQDLEQACADQGLAPGEFFVLRHGQTRVLAGTTQGPRYDK